MGARGLISGHAERRDEPWRGWIACRIRKPIAAQPGLCPDMENVVEAGRHAAEAPRWPSLADERDLLQCMALIRGWQDSLEPPPCRWLLSTSARL